MTDSNIKIVKLDPTGVFIQKDEPKEEEPSIKSVYTEDSSSSEEEEKNDIISNVPDEKTEETDNNIQKESEPINHLGGAEDSSQKSHESQDYQEKDIESDLQDPQQQENINSSQSGGYNNNNNNNENEDEETEVFDWDNSSFFEFQR